MGNNLTLLKIVKSPNIHIGGSVVITGASSGIGRELAIRYATRKSQLVISGRNAKELQKTADMCISQGAQEVQIVLGDLSLKENCQKLIQSTIQSYGRINVLVLCAGVSAHQLFEKLEDIDIFEKLMATNFYGYLYCTQAAVQHLRQTQGQILVVSSISGEIGLPYRTAYCASKFAVTGFFEALRSELDNSIAITIVCPPSVNTNFRKHALLSVESQNSNEERMDLTKAVDSIMAAADRRARKIYFPFKVYFAAYIRPFFPDFVDRRMKAAAKL